ncbi:bifunctional 3'-5' exonuclease/DNA polymerase [Microbacterium sp. NPDC076911]|uniref:bifunctional 3'-5' exonuclease/DNA polymerase n=1 Tax=Microbacterium sp. NPDC076911 TaxID=3154958 RepID=UPI00343DD654
MRTPVSDGARHGWVALGTSGERVHAVVLDAAGVTLERVELSAADFPGWAIERESTSAPRWVWNDTPRWYPRLLRAGLQVSRCHDLRLSHLVLAASDLVVDAAALRAASRWHAPPYEAVVPRQPALFDWDSDTARDELPADVDETVAEFARQQAAITQSTDPNRLRLLTAAESAGALVASELHVAGLPWSREAHEQILHDSLGTRDTTTGIPTQIFQLRQQIGELLGDSSVSLDSQPKLIRALHRAGVLVESTSRWELAEQQHPVIAPLLEYKKLTRLLSANGWAWLDEWVHDERFRPVYVPSGVVTGRWASSGGGALQIPRQLRSAVHADPGWKLVVADVAQLEPRVLAAMAADTNLADAAFGRDLYAGIVNSGTIASRSEAKIAMLGAMYGATSGESGRLVPRLRRSYPRAMALVDSAAQTGENGGTVRTWLGRTCPPPSVDWQLAQAQASDSTASEAEVARARRLARDRGRFTRNYIVQGTAAEWALAWLGDLRSRLARLPPAPATERATASGTVFGRQAHLAFFLHDEVIVHAHESQAAAAAEAVRAAAEAAGRLLFGEFRVDFPLDVSIADSAAKE